MVNKYETIFIINPDLSEEDTKALVEKFKTLLSIPELSLDYRYQQLKKQYDLCRSKSDEVSRRITLIEEVSEALFNEWEAELELYANRSLRAQSRQQLNRARRQYGKLMTALKKAEERIHPVLGAFQDQVLFLKHNLNAQAIALLQKVFATARCAILGDIGWSGTKNPFEIVNWTHPQFGIGQIAKHEGRIQSLVDDIDAAVRQYQTQKGENAWYLRRDIAKYLTFW